MGKLTKILVLFSGVMVLMAFSACKQQEPAESVGEKIGAAVEQAEEKIEETAKMVEEKVEGAGESKEESGGESQHQ